MVSIATEYKFWRRVKLVMFRRRKSIINRDFFRQNLGQLWRPVSRPSNINSMFGERYTSRNLVVDPMELEWRKSIAKQNLQVSSSEAMLDQKKISNFLSEFLEKKVDQLRFGD